MVPLLPLIPLREYRVIIKMLFPARLIDPRRLSETITG